MKQAFLKALFVAAIVVCLPDIVFSQTPSSKKAKSTTAVPAKPVESKEEHSSTAETDTLQNLFEKAANSANTIPPVVVRFSPGDPEEAGHLSEDLSVMTRIFDRALERAFGKESVDHKMGVPLLLSSGGRSVRAMYTEGFGVLFTLKVNFPLMAPSASSGEKRLEADPDSDWDKAKEEIYGQPLSIVQGEDNDGPDVEFDASRVATLKQTLLESLKNAAKIRGLKTTEYVTVTVFGSPARFHSANWVNGHSGRTSSPVVGDGAAATRTSSSSHGTVYTLRVKKSDVDAFANGKMDLAALDRSAIANAYPGYGYKIPSVNSWIKQGRSRR